MRILICGDRAWNDAHTIWDVLSRLSTENQIEEVIEGEANGADTHARIEAQALGLRVTRVPANWDAYHHAAGPIRNRQMLDMKPDRVYAFHNNLADSKGTRDCVKEALKRGIPVFLVTVPPGGIVSKQQTYSVQELKHLPM